MATGKRPRGREGRIGVFWRKDPIKCVVEMRVRGWETKLNFGSYDTLPKAMVARDYGAFLRVAAGENGADAGGFDAAHPPSIYEFEESPDIFESMKETEDRCDQYKKLRSLYFKKPTKKWSGNGIPPHKEFCQDARKDIAVAIEEFRQRHPHKLRTSQPTETTEDLPTVEPIDGETQSAPSSSNAEVRVSPQLTGSQESGAITEDSSDAFTSLIFTVSVDGSTLGARYYSVPRLTQEQILKISFPGFDRIHNELVDKFLAEVDPCLLKPADIDPLEE